LRLPDLKTDVKYQDLIARYVHDLQFVQSEYNNKKEDPPIARNLPPISGKIAWSRTLYHRISTPLAAFQKNHQLMQLPETRKAIKLYNHLARVLVEYELVFLQLWDQQIDSAKASLNSTVLIRHPDSNELMVNFDPKIKELLRNVQVLNGMGVEVPTRGLMMYAQKVSLMEKLDKINVSCHTTAQNRKRSQTPMFTCLSNR
jgi:dynein heavy chain